MTKPIHALTAYVPTDVWCRLLPRSPQCALGSMLPGTPHPSLFCPEYRFSSGRIWRWVWGFIHIYDSFDTWQRKYADGGERQEICLRSHIWERWPHCVNMNEGGKLMLLHLLPPLPPSCSLCYLFTFHSASTQPPRFLCQTWQMQSEGGYRWIWLPSLFSPIPGCKEIRAVCNIAWDGKGQLVNQCIFYFMLFIYFLPLELISIQSRNGSLFPSENRLLPGLAWE